MDTVPAPSSKGPKYAKLLLAIAIIVVSFVFVYFFYPHIKSVLNLLSRESSVSESAQSTETSKSSAFKKNLHIIANGCVHLDLNAEHLEKGTLLDRSSNYRIYKISTKNYPELYLDATDEQQIYKVYEDCRKLIPGDLDPKVKYDIAIIKPSNKPVTMDLTYDGKDIKDAKVLYQKELILYVY
ncbi:MAG TPA: hypothetical protein VLI92_02490 [Candidatus Saccharimonadales bacterium]|nr:hypothetical protein [Candidatus Saccharimonadales bacterium]